MALICPRFGKFSVAAEEWKEQIQTGIMQKEEEETVNHASQEKLTYF